MKLRVRYAWAWIAWVVMFIVLETKAILDDSKEDGNFTLSHFVRRLAARSWTFRIFIAGILIWLTAFNHFELF